MHTKQIKTLKNSQKNSNNQYQDCFDQLKKQKNKWEQLINKGNSKNLYNNLYVYLTNIQTITKLLQIRRTNYTTYYIAIII